MRKAILSLNHIQVIYTLHVYKWKTKLNRKPTLIFVQATLHNNRNYWFYPGKVRKKTTCFFSVKHKCSQASNMFCLTRPRGFGGLLLECPLSWTTQLHILLTLRLCDQRCIGYIPPRKPCLVTFNQALFSLPALQNTNTDYKNVSTSKEQTHLKIRGKE